MPGKSITRDEVARMSKDMNAVAHYLWMIHIQIQTEMDRGGRQIVAFRFQDQRETAPTDAVRERVIAELRREGFRVRRDRDFDASGHRPWLISWQVPARPEGSEKESENRPARFSRHSRKAARS